MQERQLFLYLKTGGGHLAPARSVANYLKENYPEKVNPILEDGFKGVASWVKTIVEDGYRKSQANAVWIFEILYAFNKIKPITRITALLLSWFILPHLEKTILKNQPVKIVIFHFFLIRPVLEIIQKNKLNISVITVVTDPFTAHPIWFLKKETRFVVFSERVKKYALRKGIGEDQIDVFPFILDEKFTRPMPEVLIRTLKDNLGFDKQKRLILILGGGDGMPRGAQIIRKLLKNNPQSQMAIVCGNNRKLYTKAKKIQQRASQSSLKIFGYVDFVYELINMADVVVTKCGASTFMEILISGKIPVINNYIWEQEKGNMEFVRDNLLGIYEKSTNRLPHRIKDIIHNPIRYRQYQSNIENMGIKNGTPLVSAFLISKTI